MGTIYTAVLFPLLLLIGQTLVALGQRKISQRMDEDERKRDEAREATDAKRAAEAAWREDMERRMQTFEQQIAKQDGKIDAVLRGQLTQMRSDIVHKAHRYLDDLCCASTEEKLAFDAEYKEYAALCKAYDIENDFLVSLHEQVMTLRGRSIDTDDSGR